MQHKLWTFMWQKAMETATQKVREQAEGKKASSFLTPELKKKKSWSSDDGENSTVCSALPDMECSSLEASAPHSLRSSPSSPGVALGSIVPSDPLITSVPFLARPP